MNKGLKIEINVTISNEGDFTEIMEVWLHNSSIIALLNSSVEVILSGENPTITFVCVIPTYLKWNYTLFAIVSIVYNEIDVYDDAYTDNVITITIIGGITGITG